MGHTQLGQQFFYALQAGAVQRGVHQLELLNAGAIANALVIYSLYKIIQAFVVNAHNAACLHTGFIIHQLYAVKAVHFFDCSQNFICHFQRDLAAIGAIHFIAVVLGRVVGCRYHDTGIAVIIPGSKAQCGNRHQGAVNAHLYAVGGQNFGSSLGSGVNVLVATHFGARSEKNVRESVHTSFLVCLIAGFLMLALGLIFARPLLELLNTRDDLIDGAELYLRIYFLGMPAAALYNYGNGVLNAIGDTKTPLIFLSAAGVLNVILDLVFVIGLGMSTDGVALASMLSQCVSAGLIVRSLMRSKEIYSLSLKEVRFHKDKAIHALSVGVPAGLQNAIFSVANLFIQAGVNSFSTVVVEGNSAAGNVDNLVYSVMNAFYIACSSFVGQNYGAGKSRRVLKSYLLTLCYSAVAAAVLGGLFLLFGHQFLSLFTSESDVIEAGLARIWVMCFSFPISATMDCTTAASRGLGKGLVPMIFVFLGSCVFRVAWIYTVFAHFHTIRSLYMLYPFSWVLTGAAEIAYFLYCYKKYVKPLDASHAAE